MRASDADAPKKFLVISEAPAALKKSSRPFCLMGGGMTGSLRNARNSGLVLISCSTCKSSWPTTSSLFALAAATNRADAYLPGTLNRFFGGCKHLVRSVTFVAYQRSQTCTSFPPQGGVEQTCLLTRTMMLILVSRRLCPVEGWTAFRTHAVSGASKLPKHCCTSSNSTTMNEYYLQLRPAAEWYPDIIRVAQETTNECSLYYHMGLLRICPCPTLQFACQCFRIRRDR
jgi:hypothetical protein